jgi:aminoglycoside/choline kinase family phosphotransferase
MSASSVASRDSAALASAVQNAFPRSRIDATEMLAGDASARRYARLRLSGDAPSTMIALLLPRDTPPGASEEISTLGATAELPFVSLQRFLARHDVPVPALHFTGEEVLLLEDLGDLPLADAASAPDRDALFVEAVDVLAHIAALAHDPDPSCVAFQQRYDRALIARELAVVCSHGFAPSDQGPARRAGADRELEKALAGLGDRIAAQPLVLMHRDFHAWNLHVDATRQVRVIDFQDASLGPALYDLASLCTDRDSDRFIDATLEETLVRRFGEALLRCGGPAYHDAARLRADYFDAVAYRTLRVIGRFRFLAIEKGKPGYLRFLPRMARQTRRALEANAEHELLRVLASRSTLFAA